MLNQGIPSWIGRREILDETMSEIMRRDKESPEALDSPLVLRFINTTTFVASIFGSGEARRGSIPRSGAVTEEQQNQNRKATQPSGRRFFSAQTSLLAPSRPLKGMRVARASSEPKIPRRKRGRIYEMEYLAGSRTLQRL